MKFTDWFPSLNNELNFDAKTEGFIVDLWLAEKLSFKTMRRNITRASTVSKRWVFTNPQFAALWFDFVEFTVNVRLFVELLRLSALHSSAIPVSAGHD